MRYIAARLFRQTDVPNKGGMEEGKSKLIISGISMKRVETTEPWLHPGLALHST
jgi:hypothetical protein